ncbi:hypothetical protein ACX0G9_22190 [Flavitalea flava]
MADSNISGYCLVSMPSDQIKPLSILSMEKTGIANMTGATIEDFFIDSEVALPAISPDYNLSTEVNRSVSVELSVDGHLSLLQTLLSFLKLSASFKLEKNRSVTVQLMEAKKNTVNEFKLDAFINSALTSKIAPSFLELLHNDQLFVVTDILKCKKYSFAYNNNTKTDSGITADAPLQGDVTAGIHTGSSGHDSVIYEGDQFITIGVIAYRIFYKKDKATGEDSYRIRREESLRTVKDDEDFPGETLTTNTTIN